MEDTGFVPLDIVPMKWGITARLKVYALVDPRFSDVRYVGVTSQSLDYRLRMHLRYPTNRRTREWFAQLRAENREPMIIAIHGVSGSWQRAEMEWIAWFRARGDLLNVDAGGMLCERGSGWDDIKREKAIAIMATACRRSHLDAAPPHATKMGRPKANKGAKTKKRKAFGWSVPKVAHQSSIEPTIRKSARTRDRI